MALPARSMSWLTSDRRLRSTWDKSSVGRLFQTATMLLSIAPTASSTSVRRSAIPDNWSSISDNLFLRSTHPVVIGSNSANIAVCSCATCCWVNPGMGTNVWERSEMSAPEITDSVGRGFGVCNCAPLTCAAACAACARVITGAVPVDTARVRGCGCPGSDPDGPGADMTSLDHRRSVPNLKVNSRSSRSLSRL